MEPGSFHWCQLTEQGTMNTNFHTKFHLYEEELLHSEGDRALEEVVQRGCGVSSSRNVQDFSGHDPVEPVLDELQMSHPTLMIL